MEHTMGQIYIYVYMCANCVDDIRIYNVRVLSWATNRPLHSYMELHMHTYTRVKQDVGIVQRNQLAIY